MQRVELFRCFLGFCLKAASGKKGTSEKWILATSPLTKHEKAGHGRCMFERSSRCLR